MRQSAANDDKNVPEQEQTALTVDTEGYEKPFDAKRKDVEPASEMVKKLQKVDDVIQERDNLSKKVEVLTEKTRPEMVREIREIL